MKRVYSGAKGLALIGLTDCDFTVTDYLSTMEVPPQYTEGEQFGFTNGNVATRWNLEQDLAKASSTAPRYDYPQTAHTPGDPHPWGQTDYNSNFYGEDLPVTNLVTGGYFSNDLVAFFVNKITKYDANDLTAFNFVSGSQQGQLRGMIIAPDGEDGETVGYAGFSADEVYGLVSADDGCPTYD